MSSIFSNVIIRCFQNYLPQVFQTNKIVLLNNNALSRSLHFVLVSINTLKINPETFKSYDKETAHQLQDSDSCNQNYMMDFIKTTNCAIGSNLSLAQVIYKNICE